MADQHGSRVRPLLILPLFKEPNQRSACLLVDPYLRIISVRQFLLSHRTKKKNIQMSQTILIDDLKAKKDDISSGEVRNVPRKTQQLYHCQWLIGSEEEKHSKDVFD